MSVRIEAIHEQPAGPIHLVIAGYRAKVPREALVQANFDGSTYAVHWAAGRWTDASASAGVLARSVRVAVPAMRGGQVLAGLGTLASGAGGVAVVGASQFRHRLYCARRDGALLAAALQKFPQIADSRQSRPLSLYGHSLGTVVLRSALTGLRQEGFRIQDLLLMGGIASRHGWTEIADCFSGRLRNWYSPRDYILNIAPVFDRLVGNGEILERIADRVGNENVCSRLPNPLSAFAHHSGYWRLLREVAW